MRNHVHDALYGVSGKRDLQNTAWKDRIQRRDAGKLLRERLRPIGGVDFRVNPTSTGSELRMMLTDSNQREDNASLVAERGHTRALLIGGRAASRQVSNTDTTSGHHS